MSSADDTGAATPNAALDYLRNCYAAALDWYKVADSKAQLIVTLNGLIVTVVTGTAFASPDELHRRLDGASHLALSALVVAAACVVAALVCAVLCLFSRLDDRSLRRLHGFDADGRPNPLTPQVAWWFGMIATLSTGRAAEGAERAKVMSDYLMTADDEFEVEALASQIVVLSQNTLGKHRWVDRGWLATVAGLIAIVLFGVFYTVGVLD
ncbi:hypothetical protein GCM10009798_13740 [Nocardioides panacihumi]|uniref:Pycsar effector protein domain-containing protein n=1 Tax=Nocardioides panacihumi TaxID=400774 RepID=A0ABP5C2X6_9ACTN